MTVELYFYEVKIDGLMYEGTIPARSWQEARRVAKAFGGKVNGKRLEKNVGDQSNKKH